MVIDADDDDMKVMAEKLIESRLDTLRLCLMTQALFGMKMIGCESKEQASEQGMQQLMRTAYDLFRQYQEEGGGGDHAKEYMLAMIDKMREAVVKDRDTEDKPITMDLSGLMPMGQA